MACGLWLLVVVAVSDGDDNLPLAIALIGGALLTGYMAYRPWPVSDGKTVKPGAYAFEILEGQTPAAGPPAVSPAEVQATEYALDMVLGVWAVTKLSKVLVDVATTLYDAVMAGIGGLAPLLGAGGGGEAAGGEAGTAGEGEASGEGEGGTTGEEPTVPEVPDIPVIP
jgi:hypothetical protein